MMRAARSRRTASAWCTGSFPRSPDAALIERERNAIFSLQEAQQRNVIAQLLKEREMLNAEQRAALADLLLEQDPRNAGGAQRAR